MANACEYFAACIASRSVRFLTIHAQMPKTSNFRLGGQHARRRITLWLALPYSLQLYGGTILLGMWALDILCFPFLSDRFVQTIGEEIRSRDKFKLLRDEEMFACGTASGRWLGVIVWGGLKSEASPRARMELRAPTTSNATVADMCQSSNAEHQAFLRTLIADHLPFPSQLGSCDASDQRPQYCSAAAAKSLALLFTCADDVSMSWLAGFNAASAGHYSVCVALTVSNSSIPAFEFVTSQSTFKFWALFTRSDHPSQLLRFALALNPAGEHSVSLDSAWLASLVLADNSPHNGLISALTLPPSSSAQRPSPLSFSGSTAAEFLGSLTASLC